MATSNKDRRVESVGKLHWGLIALAILITLAIIALANNVNNIRAERPGPAQARQRSNLRQSKVG